MTAFVVEVRMKLKITTLNIWRYYGDWKQRKMKIVDFLKKEQPDIVFLQEVFDDTRHNEPGNHQALQLNRDLAFQHCIFDVVEQLRTENNQPVTVPVFDGLACLTNFPVVSSQLIRLRQQPDDHHFRALQRVEVNVFGRKILFYHPHFSNRDDWGKTHLRETLEFAENEKSTPIIVGDLNIRIVSDIQELAGKAYDLSYNVKPYLSYPTKNETLDYVLIPKGRLCFVEVRCENEGLSDHRPLTVVMEDA